MADEAQGRFLPGYEFSDSKKNRWILKSFIGVTNSTEDYLAAPHNDEGSTNYPTSVVIKIEPDEDGSRPTHMRFYINHANEQDINKWIAYKRFKYGDLAIPRLLGSGSHERDGKKYHFIVTDHRKGTDLWKLFEEHGKQFPEHTVYKIGYDVMRVLEYIHSKKYVHGNIAGKFLILDMESKRHIYLTNYASVSPYSSDDIVNSTWVHNSTTEYLSRDHHMGVPTMRGDIEMLLYIMIHWLGVTLPWDDHLENPDKVQQLKENALKMQKENIEKFLDDCFKSEPIPCPILKFTKLLASMHSYDEPNYTELRKCLDGGLRQLNHVPYTRLQFKVYPVYEVPASNTIDNKIPKRHKKEEFIEGLQVSVKKLAGIISENFSSLAEVDLYSTDPCSPLDIIIALTTIKEDDVDKINGLRRAWEYNTARLKTKVIELWREKGITVQIDQSSSTSGTVGTASRSIQGNSVGEVCINASEATRKTSAGGGDRVARCKKRKMDEQSSESDSDSFLEQDSPSLSRRGVYKNLSTYSCTASPSNRLQSPIFSGDSCSSGIGSRPSSGLHWADPMRSKTPVLTHDNWSQTYNWLDTWLRLKEQTLEALSAISLEPQLAHSQVQELRVLHDEYMTKLPRLDELSNRPSSPDNAQQLLKEIRHRWQDFRTQLHNRKRKLSTACLRQPHDVLRRIKDSLCKLPVDGDAQEKLRKLEILGGQLEAEQTPIANATKIEQLCQNFGDSVPTEHQLVVELQLELQHEINSRKAEIERNLDDERQFKNSCQEIVVWLNEQLGAISSKLLASSDREMLQRQCETHEEFYQCVTSKENEVTGLLNKGRGNLVRSQNLENRSTQQRYFDMIQDQWYRLKRQTFDFRQKLQKCADYCEKYHEARDPFLAWLSETENNFESLKSGRLDGEENIKQHLDDLALFSNRVQEKLTEFEQNISLGEVVVDACDQDKDDVIKIELVNVRQRWSRLNDGLQERTRAIEDTYGQFSALSESLREIKRKLELYEDELTTRNSLEEAFSNPTFCDRTTELKQETNFLDESCKVAIEKATELVPKARKHGVDANRLLDEMYRTRRRIADLTWKLTDNYKEISKHTAVNVKKEPDEQEGSESKMIVSLPNIRFDSNEIIDLVSSDEGELDDKA